MQLHGRVAGGVAAPAQGSTPRRPRRTVAVSASGAPKIGARDLQKVGGGARMAGRAPRMFTQGRAAGDGPPARADLLPCTACPPRPGPHAPQVAEAAAAAGAAVITAALDKPRNISSKGSVGDIVTDTGAARGARVGAGRKACCCHSLLPCHSCWLQVATCDCVFQGAALTASKPFLAHTVRAPTRPHPHPPPRRHSPPALTPTPLFPADKAAEVACVQVISSAFPGHAIMGEEGGVVTGDVASEYLWW